MRHVLDRARADLAGADGPDRGDVLRIEAERAGYGAVQHHVRELRMIESELAAGALVGWDASALVEEHALDVIRRHLLRGMGRAHLELGDHVIFWRPR